MAGIAAETPRAPSAFALRPRILRTLLGLRWQLLLRGYSRSPGRIVGAIVLFVFLVPPVILLAIAEVSGFQYLLPDQFLVAQNIVFYILIGLYLLYAFLPLLQFSLNEGLDVTKLAAFPLSQPELMAGLLIATLLDIPTLAVVIVFVGIGMGWATGLASALGIGAALFVMYIQLVGISQLLLSAMLGILRTRRFRDLALVLITLLGLSCSLASQAVSRLIPADQSANGLLALVHYDIGPWVQYLPPGMAGRAIAAFSAGQWSAGTLWLTALVASAFLILWAWSAILARALATPAAGANGSRRRARAHATVALPAPVAAPIPAVPERAPLIPAPVLALAAKDLRYYWRDPQYKRAFLSTLYLVGIILLDIFTLGGQQGRSFNQLIVGAALFQVLNLTAFTFGYEGNAVTTLAIFPIRPAHVFLGRNIATFIIGFVELAILDVLLGFITHDWYQAGVLAIIGLGAILAALGPGNLIAVLLPMRITRQRVGGSQADSGTGCATGLISSLAYLGALVVIAPIAALAVVPGLVGHPELALPLAPLSILYGIGIYVAGTALAASQYYERLPKIIEVVAKE
jgi:ABC-2 type transport system permease protein